MNMTELIGQVNEKYPKGVSDASIALKADVIQKRIYRKLKKQNFVTYDLVTGQSEYALTMPLTSVFQVDVRNAASGKYCRYPLRKMKDITNNCSKYHYFISDPDIGDWVGIYPPPTDNEDAVTLFYYEVPATLTVDSPRPMLLEDYHEMLVYGVCREIAESYRDTDMVSAFTIQYTALESDLLALGKESDVLTVRNEMGW